MDLIGELWRRMGERYTEEYVSNMRKLYGTEINHVLMEIEEEFKKEEKRRSIYGYMIIPKDENVFWELIDRGGQGEITIYPKKEWAEEDIIRRVYRFPALKEFLKIVKVRIVIEGDASE